MQRLSIRILLSLLLAALSLNSGCTGSKTSKVINVYNWADYIGPTTNADFTAATGIHVNYTTFATNEELFSKLQASPNQYDVVFPSDYMAKNMIEKGMLQPLSLAQIPNTVNLGSRFRPGSVGFDPEGKYVIPYHFGTVGFGYDSATVKNPPRSFKDLLRHEFKGRASVLDDMRYTMGAALKTLGYSANTTDTHQLDAALTLLRELKGNIKEFNSTTYHEMLAAGQLDVVFGYNAGLIQVQPKRPSIRYVIPDEGAMLWLDSMVIPKNAPHADAANQYINYILDAKIGAAITTTVKAATPNDAARVLLDKALTSNRAVFPTEEDLSKSEFVRPLGPKSVEYERRWAELKR